MKTPSTTTTTTTNRAHPNIGVMVTPSKYDLVVLLESVIEGFCCWFWNPG